MEHSAWTGDTRMAMSRLPKCRMKCEVCGQSIVTVFEIDEKLGDLLDTCRVEHMDGTPVCEGGLGHNYKA